MIIALRVALLWTRVQGTLGLCAFHVGRQAPAVLRVRGKKGVAKFLADRPIAPPLGEKKCPGSKSRF
jgi:hypothetical protein